MRFLILSIVIVLAVLFLCARCCRADEGLDNLTMAIIAEAIGEGPQGIEAVACCVRNRIRTGLPKGLSAANRKDLTAFVALQPEALVKGAYRIVREVMAGRTPDVTNGALYFESTDFPKPKWANEMKVCYRYKKHIFYKP